MPQFYKKKISQGHRENLIFLRREKIMITYHRQILATKIELTD